MSRMSSRTSLTVLAMCVAFVSSAAAQPKKGKAKPVTQDDLDRVEKKVEAQQQLLQKMVKLQQQYTQALAALADGTAPPAPVVDKPVEKVPDKPVEKVADKPADKPDKPARPTPKADPKPAKPKPTGVGTVVGKVMGVSNAIVYVEDIGSSAKGATATMKQEGKQFIPEVLVVQRGTRVEFPNRDAIFHNVFSMSPDNTFDLGSYPQGDSKSVLMSRAGVVTVYCNMHPQMVGHILVVPNGNFVRAGADGFFRLSNIPAGPHKIVAWAPNSKPMTVSTEVTEGQVVTVEVELKKGRSGSHTKKDGLPYGSYEQ